MTFTTLFSGIGGKCAGFKSAGLTPVNHFEIDARIAEIGQASTSGTYVVGDVCEQNWHRFEAPDVLGASPVCKNFSIANNGAEESPLDFATAEATMRAFKAWRPKMFFLENVWGYRNSKAFAFILHELHEANYNVAFWHLNAADYGVPQTRKRLILVALRDFKGTIRRPPATHEEHPKARLFDSLERWRGWYEAIEDLIPTLPESAFAPWQLARLERLQVAPQTLMVPGGNASNDTVLMVDAPASTIVATQVKVGMPQAFLMGDQYGQKVGATAPAFTVTAKDGSFAPAPVRAFIIDGRNTRTTDGQPPTVRDESEPVFTVAATEGSERHRAFVLDKATPQKRLFEDGFEFEESGRVVAMTPRALCRFQGFPDSFQLSGHRKTDCVGIGNAVAPLLAQRVIEHCLPLL